MEDIRITSGILRGRKVRSPKLDSTHPMGSREKIALFNMISDFLPDAVVLDAFAGSGALGIEALSRGAAKVVFVEKNRKVAEVIRDNLNSLNLSHNSRLVICGVSSFSSDELFDIIIADPPYDNFIIEEIFHLTKFLKDYGVLVLSHPGDTPVIDGLKLTKTRKYAGATLSIYRK